MGPRVLIIGASLAGLRSAEAVLETVPDAQVTIVGDEPYAPYNRPPLSKEALEGLASGKASLQNLTLRHRLAEGAVTWRLGVRAVSVDARDRTVLLGDGEALPYDWMIAATGLRPRRLAVPEGDARYVLRSLDDATRLAAAMRPGARMLVVGAGFIGCELAATAVKLGLTVTVIEQQAQPMLAALGPRVSGAMADFHRAHGVDLRCGISVADVADGALILSDSSTIVADLIVEAAGSLPNVDWLHGAGLNLTDGILCDATLTAQGSDRILAVGDVARFPNVLFDTAPRRVEHWSIPGLTARRGAETIAAREAGAEPPARFAPLPSFWSDQHGLRLQSFGAPGLGDDLQVLEGDFATLGCEACLIEYRRAGQPVGILGLGAAPAALAQHRLRLESILNETVAA